MTEFWRHPALPQLEVRRSCQENSCYRPHSHESLSIGLIDDGTSLLAGRRGAPSQLGPGDVVVIPGGHTHSCNPDGGRWRYRMIHAEQVWASELMPGRSREPLLSGISVFRDEALYEAWRDLTDGLFAGSPLAGVVAEFETVFRVLDRVSHERANAVRSSDSGDGGGSDADAQLRARLAPVFARLLGDEVNPSLAELGGLVGMDRHQLSRAMRRVTGLAPIAWRQNARVERARAMLRDGVPIAQAAQQLGFVDQSHFRRVFAAHVAASPGAYRS